jgi:hypothetical protein
VMPDKILTEGQLRYLLDWVKSKQRENLTTKRGAPGPWRDLQNALEELQHRRGFHRHD